MSRQCFACPSRAYNILQPWPRELDVKQVIIEEQEATGKGATRGDPGLNTRTNKEQLGARASLLVTKGSYY